MSIRVGNGFDVHALVEGRPLVIGGVTIPFDKGLARSFRRRRAPACARRRDSGRACAGRPGRAFPDTDPRWKGANSRDLLRHVRALAAARGYWIGNVDATVIAQAPKLAPHVAAMRENIAADLGCEIGEVSVKATTTEHLGFTGRGEGIAALAIVLLGEAAPPGPPRSNRASRADGQRHARDRAAAVARQQVERAAMQSRDAIDDGKPEPRAGRAVGARARCRRARERLLQALDFRGRDAGDRDRRCRGSARRRAATSHLDRRRAVGERVVDQVGDQPRHRRRAQRDRRNVAGAKRTSRPALA